MTTETDLGAEASRTSQAQGTPPPEHLQASPAIQINMPKSAGVRNGFSQSHPQTGSPENHDNVEGLLHTLMSRLDENDRRYGAALENMNSRLIELGERAQSAEGAGPAQSVAALEGVQKKASTLAEHIEAAERQHRAHRNSSPQNLAQRISVVADHIDTTGANDHDQRFDPHPGPAQNDDFADVTKRLEDSLTAHPQANEFDYLASRMDDLANRFDTALNNQDNVQALETIESQLNSLTNSFSGAQQQHTRIEAIESHLHNLMDWANTSDARTSEKTGVRFDVIERAIKALNDNACAIGSQTASTLETMNATLLLLAKRIEEPVQKASPQKHAQRDAPQADYPEVWIADDNEADPSTGAQEGRYHASDPNLMGANIPDYQSGPEYPETSASRPDSLTSKDKAIMPNRQGLGVENDFIASAQRAAAAADAQETPASPLRAENRRLPGYENSSLLTDSKRQRPLLVMAAVGLLLVSAGLLYSRLKTTSETASGNGAAQMVPQIPASPSTAPSGAGTPPSKPSNVKPAGGTKQHSGRLQNQNDPAPSNTVPKKKAVRVSQAQKRTSSAAIAAQATQTLSEPRFNQPISTATVLASLPQNTKAEPMSGVSVSIKDAVPALVPPGNKNPLATLMAQPKRVPAPGRTARVSQPSGSLDSASANNSASAMPPATIGPQSLRMAAARGNPAAQVEVASRYAKGSGITKNLEKAVEWFGRAAAQGYAPAQYRLAALHERGKGVKPDIGMAQTWYRRAAELGHVRAMHNLAVLYTRPGGKGPNYETAKNWFYQSARYGLADSQFNLGILYERGLGTRKNVAEAYKWFTLAARQGDNAALKRRELIRPKLSANALSAIEQTLKSWKPVPVKQAANRTGPPKGGWQNARTENDSAGSDPALIARAQYLLNKLGYDAGAPDGKMGPKTAAAIRNFEGATGKPSTGKVTPVLLRRLAVLSG